MGKKISNLDELFREYGGTTLMAQRWRVKHNTVSMWAKRGYLPPAYHLAILADLKARGCKVDGRLFGMSKKEFAPLSCAGTSQK